jgi:hypothetical protein
MRAPSSEAPASLDELVGAILEELDFGKGCSAFAKRMAAMQVRHEIERLRRFAEEAERQPLGEVAEQIARVSKRAQALAESIERLSKDGRAHLRWSVFGGVAFDPSGFRPSRMEPWLADLHALAVGDQWRLDSFIVKLQDRVAMSARHLMKSLAPHVEITRTGSSKFYLIASLLWEAVTGEHRKDGIRRACDKNIAEFRKFILK